MKTVAVVDMRRGDYQVYTVLEGKCLTREELARETKYSPASITRIVARLQRERHIRAIRQGKKTFYERIS
jgi:transcription initiation factor IIE alpha subunit